MMKVALYCRVSTDLQEKEQTIQSQVEALRKYAHDKGYEVVAEFLDDGYSGATLERPALDKLRDALRSGEFEAVLVHSPDRLARKAVYQGLLLEELEKAGVKIEFLNHPVDDSPEGKMLLGMQGLFAEYERAKIAERARRGKLHWAKQGSVFTGFVPYGYRYVPRDGEGSRRSSLVIDEAQAAVVQQMYRWLIEERLSCRAIAKRLTEQGTPTCTGKTRWQPSSVNQMLKDEVYKGVFYYNRGQSVGPTHSSRPNPYRKHKLTGRKLRPRDEWIPIPVPAIVDEITWEASQRQLHENSVHSPRNNTRHLYLLRGLIRCPRCGGAYVGSFARGHRYYRCSRTEPLAAKDGVCCQAGRIAAEPVEAAVWSAISEGLQNRDLLIEEYRRRTQQQNAIGALDTERRQIETALKRLKAQQDRVTDAYINEAMELGEYKARMDELRERKQRLEKQLADLEHLAECQARQKDVLTRLEAFCETVARGLESLTFEERQQLLRLVVERIVVEDGKVRVDGIIPLDGRIAGDDTLRPQYLDPFLGY